MIEGFWIYGVSVRVPSCWDYVTIEGRTFRRVFLGNGVAKWRPL